MLKVWKDEEETVLFGVVEDGCPDVLKALRVGGANPNLRDNNGLTALMLITKQKRYDQKRNTVCHAKPDARHMIAKHLLDHGARVNERDDDKLSALDYLILKNAGTTGDQICQEKLLELLLRAGAE